MAADIPPLGFPLRLESSTFTGCDFYVTTNFVDHDAATGRVEDYECGDRSYDLSSPTYNHPGTDYRPFPFPWYKMDHDLVAVVAAAPGEVAEREEEQYDRNCEIDFANDPNMVVIQHDDGSAAFYLHLKAHSVPAYVYEGARVDEGDFLGYVGSSGASTNPHLHFEIWDRDDNVIDPYAGRCNGTTSSSLWRSQPDYDDTKVLELVNSRRDDLYSYGCYDEENRAQNWIFWRGCDIHFYSYYRDRFVDTTSNHDLFKPDGSRHDGWSYTAPPADFSAGGYRHSYPERKHWTIPADAVSGYWNHEAELAGTSCTKEFLVLGFSIELLGSRIDFHRSSVLRDLLDDFDPSSVACVGSGTGADGTPSAIAWRIAEPATTVADMLPTPAGVDGSAARAVVRLDASGEVRIVGSMSTGSTSSALAWTAQPDSWQLETLPTPFGWQAGAEACAATGSICGWAAGPAGNPQPAVWLPAAENTFRFRLLPTTPVGSRGIAQGEIALPSGQWIFGRTGDAAATTQPVVWQKKGDTWNLQALPVPEGMTGGSAEAGHDNCLAGWTSRADGTRVATFWTHVDDTWVALAFDQDDAWEQSTATCVSDRDGLVVVGGMAEAQGQSRAVLWFFAEGGTDLLGGPAEAVDLTTAAGSGPTDPPVTEIADVGTYLDPHGYRLLAVVGYRGDDPDSRQPILLREVRTNPISAAWDHGPTVPNGVSASPVPNPFNARTNIAFELAAPTHVRLAIYDVKGRQVAVLVDGPLAAGPHTVPWDGCGDAGQRVPSGTYYYTLQGDGWSRRGKMALIK